MNTVLYLSASGAVYETRAYSTADVDKLLHSRGLQCVTSADGQFDFWSSPAPVGCQRKVNRTATELLAETTGLAAKAVPLLRGGVVIATRDADGDLDGLSWSQLDLLVQKNRSVSKRTERVIARRIARESARPATTTTKVAQMPVVRPVESEPAAAPLSA